MAAAQVSSRRSTPEPDFPGQGCFGPGFTVLELVVTLALVAVLLTLAVPSYQRYQQRAERAEAVRQLLAAAACQERLRAATGYFNATRCLENVESRAYRFRIEPGGQSASLVFTVIAEPAGPDTGDACGWLSLDQSGSRGVGGDGRVGDCWGGR